MVLLQGFTKHYGGGGGGVGGGRGYAREGVRLPSLSLTIYRGREKGRLSRVSRRGRRLGQIGSP